MRIATWNINSIRTRYPTVVEWMSTNDVDVALLQETKCTDEQFPFAAFAEEGYDVAHHGLNHWNGVAIASRVGIDEVRHGFTGAQRAPYDEARLISARCDGVSVWSVYVPNGRELWDPHYAFKLVWLERLRAELDRRAVVDDVAVVAGDFNVAPTDDDIYMPSRWKKRTHASAPEREGITALCDLGLVDLARHHQPEGPLYTWWNYRQDQFDKDHGLRIDLAFGSPALTERCERAEVDRAPRGGKRPSDHAPLVIDIR